MKVGRHADLRNECLPATLYGERKCNSESGECKSAGFGNRSGTVSKQVERVWVAVRGKAAAIGYH